MKRHIYNRPKANRKWSYSLAVVGGLVFTFLVFYLIPLMKKLEAGLPKSPSTMEESLALEPPETFEFPEPEPPPEEDIEEPPELVEQTDLDISLDIPLDLGAGTGGGIKIMVPDSFQVAGDADSFGTGDITSPPRPTARVDPRYPRDMLKKKRGGRVLVTVTVDERGIVTEARIKESSGHASLDTAALTAAKRWKFKAGIKEGRKAVMTAVIPFNFKVKS